MIPPRQTSTSPVECRTFHTDARPNTSARFRFPPARWPSGGWSNRVTFSFLSEVEIALGLGISGCFPVILFFGNKPDARSVLLSDTLFVSPQSIDFHNTDCFSMKSKIVANEKTL
jgi:hypothetical protein